MEPASKLPPVLLTGASDGIGRSMALAFARRGYPLGLLARREPQLEAVSAACRAAGSPQVVFASVDVMESETFRAKLIELDAKLGGRTGIFVANAGGDAATRVKEDCGPQARKVFGLNLTAAVDGMELMKALMIQRGTRGTLVGVSSVAGARGLAGASIYSASKAGFNAYLEAIRADVHRFGIRVIEIAPGFIATTLNEGSKHPMPFRMNCDLAGERFVRDVARGKRRIIHPWQYRPVYWALSVMPGWLYDWIGRLTSR